MDTADAEEIFKELNSLKSMQNNLNTEAKTQSNLNHEIMIRFSNVTEHINREQQNIKQFFNNIQNLIYKKIDNEDM